MRRFIFATSGLTPSPLLVRGVLRPGGVKNSIVAIFIFLVACGDSPSSQSPSSSSTGLSGTLAYAQVSNIAGSTIVPVVTVDLGDDTPTPETLAVEPTGATQAYDVPLGWSSDGANLVYFREYATATESDSHELHTIARDGTNDTVLSTHDGITASGGYDGHGRIWLLVNATDNDETAGVTMFDTSGTRSNPPRPAGCLGEQRALAVSAAANMLAIVHYDDRCSSEQIDVISVDDALNGGSAQTLPELGIDLSITSVPWFEFNAAGDRIYFWSDDATTGGVHSAKLDGSDDRTEVAQARFELDGIPSLPENFEISAPPHTATVVADAFFVFSGNAGDVVAVPFDANKAPFVVMPASSAPITAGAAALAWTSR